MAATPEKQPEGETMSERKERPILFSGEMVRAILDGRKTMTRRVMKLTDHWFGPDGKLKDTPYWKGEEAVKTVKWPSGEVGDWLWVRETFSYYHDLDGLHPVYLADKQDHGGNPPPHDKWHPSIHMPRWASRITLEITGVRAERLQKISYEDCLAEGIDRMAEPERGITKSELQMKGSFHRLWDSINANRGYGWDANPWVWVISFKPVTP